MSTDPTRTLAFNRRNWVRAPGPDKTNFSRTETALPVRLSTASSAAAPNPAMRLLQPRQRVNSPEGSHSRQKGTLTLKSTYLKWPVQRTTRNNHLGLALQPSYSSQPTLTPHMFFTLLPPLPISARLLVTIFPFVLATALLLSDSAVFIFTPLTSFCAMF
jgi:hypothetical protein